MLNVACCMFDTFAQRLPFTACNFRSHRYDAASVRYFCLLAYWRRETQLKCVRKLFYTNPALTFSPNEAWPKVLGRARDEVGGYCFTVVRAHKARLVAFVVYARERGRERGRARAATRH